MILLTAGLSVYAQDSSSDSGSKVTLPKAGSFTAAVIFGNGNFLDVAPASTGSSVSGAAPYFNNVSTNNNSFFNMVGGEGRYFVNESIALKLSGAAVFRNTPQRDNLPSIIDGLLMPDYESVVGKNDADVNFNLGMEYHFKAKYDRLSPWAGATIPFFYGKRSAFDPTVTAAGQVVSIGFAHTEQIGVGVQAAAGLDYFIAPGLYLGFEFKPVSFLYAKSAKVPAPGYEQLQANTTTVSFFTQPVFKFGFLF
jgi:hypothetical protein